MNSSATLSYINSKGKEISIFATCHAMTRYIERSRHLGMKEPLPIATVFSKARRIAADTHKFEIRKKRHGKDTLYFQHDSLLFIVQDRTLVTVELYGRLRGLNKIAAPVPVVVKRQHGSKKKKKKIDPRISPWTYKPGIFQYDVYLHGELHYKLQAILPIIGICTKVYDKNDVLLGSYKDMRCKKPYKAITTAIDLFNGLDHPNGEIPVVPLIPRENFEAFYDLIKTAEKNSCNWDSCKRVKADRPRRIAS